MKTAEFVNFTNEEFIGYWDGKGKKFAPGQSVTMPIYLAEHFAKHLVNRELLRKDKKGNLVHVNGDKFVSPKKPLEVPLFMELFNKACIRDEEEGVGSQGDDVDALIISANKNKEKELKENGGKEKKPNPKEPQIVTGPEDDEDDEDSFGGTPKE